MNVTTFDSSTRTWRVNAIEDDDGKYVVIVRPGEQDDPYEYNGIDIDLNDIDRVVAALLAVKKHFEEEEE